MAKLTPQQRVKILKKFLDKEFPKVTTALHFRNAFELLVATIMAAQCTDVLVNKVTEKLFKKYKSPKDFAKARLTVLQKDIYPVTFYKNKAAALIKTAKILETKYKGKVPKTLEELIE